MSVGTALQLRELVHEVFAVNFGELPNKNVGLCHFYIRSLFLGILRGGVKEPLQSSALKVL